MFGTACPNKNRHGSVVQGPDRDIPGLGDLRVESSLSRTDSTPKIADRAVCKR